MYRESRGRTLQQFGLRLVTPLRRGNVSRRVSISTELAHLDDIVSEAVKAEAITRPAVAVLPFENRSNDPENDYFSYGLTEDIIRLLARNRWLSVISRHSTIGFQGRAVDVREVGVQLGASYVMSGSVRKSGDTARITAELARAADGEQLWSDKYELQLENIFDIQEEMARQIAATIEPELSKVEQQLAARKAPESLDAWDCYQRGLWNLWRFTTPGFDSAEIYFQRAIAADPAFARGHGALSYVNIQRSLYDDPKDRPDASGNGIAASPRRRHPRRTGLLLSMRARTSSVPDAAE